MENAHPVDVLTSAMIETIRSAARRLTGFSRRQFQAEVATQYCDGSARKAERTFGWGRSAVEKGLCEKRTGLRCADAFRLRGRKKSKAAPRQFGFDDCGSEDSGVQSDSGLSAAVSGMEVSAARMDAMRIEVDPAPTDDSAPKFDGLILSRLGNRMQHALKNRRRKN